MPRTMRNIAQETMRANGITFPTILDTSDEAKQVRSQGYKINGYEAKEYVIDGTGKIVTALYENKAKTTSHFGQRLRGLCKR